MVLDVAFYLAWSTVDAISSSGKFHGTLQHNGHGGVAVSVFMVNYYGTEYEAMSPSQIKAYGCRIPI